MPEDISNWIRLVADKPLPILHNTARELKSLSNLTDTTVEQIVAVVLRDPGCTVQLFRLLTQHDGGQLLSDVFTLKHAIILLGFERVLSLYKRTPVAEKQLSGSALRGYLRVVARSYHASHYARSWAEARTDPSSEEVAVAALLNNLGELVCWRFGKGKMTQIEQMVAEKSTSRVEAEKRVLGFELEAFGHGLAERWKLPPLARDCFIPYSALEPRALGAMLASRLALNAQKGWYREETLELVEMAGEYLGLAPNAGVTHVHRTAVEACRAVQVPGVVPMAAGLLDIGAQQRLEPKAKPNKRVAFTQNIQYSQSIKALQAGNLEVNAILNSAVTGLHEGVALAYVIFAMLTVEKDAMRIRYATGFPPDMPTTGITIPLSPPNLFSRLIEKPQGIWLRQGNQNRIWPLVPASVRNLIKVPQMFAMSVFVEAKPLGIFCAATTSKQTPLDEDRYLRFRTLCTLTGKALHNLNRRVGRQ